MGALQPGLPSPMAIPDNTYKIIIDLKDCFYTIPLAPSDCKGFAFSIPSNNFTEPMRRYHWLALPQGMANSPTLCQKFVAQVLQAFRRECPSIYLIHYMDDILLAHTNEEYLLSVFGILTEKLSKKGLIVASEKIQKFPPFLILAFDCLADIFKHKKLKSEKTA